MTVKSLFTELPTGYGKTFCYACLSGNTLCYTCLPGVFDLLLSTSNSVVVACMHAENSIFSLVSTTALDAFFASSVIVDSVSTTVFAAIIIIIHIDVVCSSYRNSALKLIWYAGVPDLSSFMRRGDKTRLRDHITEFYNTVITYLGCFRPPCSPHLMNPLEIIK